MTITTTADVSRRAFLGGALGLAGTLAFAGCGSGSSSPAGRFTAMYEGSGASETIDPGTGTMFIDEARIKHIYDGLFEIDSRMRAIPRLAENAEPDPSGTVWRLRLREADWHDGGPLTADDVMFTLSRILGRQTEAQPFVAATTLSAIDLPNSRTLDARTVELRLREPSFDLPTQLASYGTRIVKAGTRDFTRPNGTGPFRFRSFTPGREFVADRNPDHWDGSPRIDALRVLSTGAEARLAAIRGRQADFVDNLSPAAQRTLRGDDGVTVHSTPNSGILYFAMKTQRAPFASADVRRAMMAMIDREELVRVALQGSGETSDDVFGRGYQYYADDLPAHTHDPDRAKALLRAAGADDLAFELFVAPVAGGFVEAAHLVARQARAIGVDVKVTIGSKDTYYTEALTKGDMTMGQSGPLAIPYHFGSRLISSAPKNFTQWSDPRFDQLYAAAQRERSVDARTRIYHDMHEILHDRGGFIFWATTPWLTAYRSGVRNAPHGVPNAHDWARFPEVIA
ncbi:ABC transporter substrate-binding protein [Gordonia soli]|uniref:Putative ABC transporter substrate-binding protein n=1 Tax=Gordonia soli NBRC 108243 TaxID=1223545 RepID=M0QNZ2_9ACTN|nr:ABC transporter substrate-binding protein [Gordonia soli]GAC69162.1 putative ABC transporter substrate-binding protein [Gordonia soli NBRC 108243]